MRKLIALPAAMVAACSTMAVEDAPPPAQGETPGYTCRSEGLDAFVGREPTSKVGAEILAKSGAKVLRWLTPGMIVTMEFRSDRVNVTIGTNNRIERVSCS